MKKKKKGSWIKKLIIAIIIFAIIGWSLYSCGKKATDMLFKEEKATIRDISNYHSFTGNISAKNEQKIMPELLSVKIKTINVKKGDTVKKGDVLMTLDTKSIGDSIEELLLTMDLAQQNSALTISEAYKVYDDFMYNVNNNLNANLNSAWQRVENALNNWVIAKKSYENEVSLNSKGYSSILISSTVNVDQAYNNLLSAQSTYDETYSREGSSEYDRTKVKAALDNAELNYELAIKNYQASKINEDIKLTSLYDSLIQAQEAYYNAVEDYNTTKNSVYQQAETYKNNIEKAELAADQSMNELKLARLYAELDKCEVKALCDGIITDLPVKEGDYTSQTGYLAVITDYDLLQVNININEYDIGKVSEGSKVEVYINALDKTVEGEIAFIDRNATVENGVSYFKSEIVFEATDEVRCGMSVEARLYTAKEEGVLTVPAEAIQTRDDGSTYVLVNGGKEGYKETNVEIGISDGSYVEIKSGLKENDVVFYTPATSDMFAEMNAD